MSTTSTPSVPQQRSLADVVDIVSGFGFPKELQGKPKGDLPFFKVGDISIAWNSGQKNLTQAQHYLDQAEASSIRAKAFPKGTVVFAKIGEAIRLNRRAILGQPSIVDNNVMGLIPKEGVVDPTYLFYWSLMLRLGDISQATTVPSVRKSDVEQLSFPWLPLDQQKRIVAEIEKQFSRLDEAVANLKRVKANLKRYKAAVLKAAVEGRLVETEAEIARREGRSYETGEQLLQRILATRRSQWQGKGKYKEPAAPDTTDLPELPAGWTWCGFEQVSVADKHALKAGPFGSALKKELYIESGYKIYGQEQVIRGDSKFGDYFIDETKFRELESCAVKPGDLLISLVGTTGKVLVLPQNTMPGIINPRLLKLSLNHSHISPEYAAYMLQSGLASHYFKLQAHGGTMEILNLGIIKALPVPLPPAAEQQRLVAEVDRRFSFLRQIEAQVDVNLQRRTVGLQQTILVHAFAGHLLWDGAVSVAHEMR